MTTYFLFNHNHEAYTSHDSLDEVQSTFSAFVKEGKDLSTYSLYRAELIPFEFVPAVPATVKIGTTAEPKEKRKKEWPQRDSSSPTGWRKKDGSPARPLGRTKATIEVEMKGLGAPLAVVGAAEDDPTEDEVEVREEHASKRGRHRRAVVA